MSAERGCEEFRELAPELALGIADGEQRARGLAHLDGCAECRRLLEELASSADELLLLAPEHEPPLGFEGRVAAAIASSEPGAAQPTRRGRRLRRGPWPAIAAAAAAAALAALGAVLVYRDDHRVASMYRDTLAEANGSYFTAGDLTTAGGSSAGHVFGYEGEPSWVLVVVAGPADRLPDGSYRCELVKAGGATVRFGTIEVEDGHGSYGRAIADGLDAVRGVRLLGPEPGSVLRASLDGA